MRSERRVLAQAGGGGWELLMNGDRLSVLQDGKSSVGG